MLLLIRRYPAALSIEHLFKKTFVNNFIIFLIFPFHSQETFPCFKHYFLYLQGFNPLGLESLDWPNSFRGLAKVIYLSLLNVVSTMTMWKSSGCLGKYALRRTCKKKKTYGSIIMVTALCNIYK